MDPDASPLRSSLQVAHSSSLHSRGVRGKSGWIERHELNHTTDAGRAGLQKDVWTGKAQETGNRGSTLQHSGVHVDGETSMTFWEASFQLLKL
jgi:hypothetical protein